MSIAASNILALQPASPLPHYRASPSFTFHPYEHQSPSPHGPLNDDHVSPPAMSTRRATRISAPFPTFLYASEPPPVTARNKQRVRPSAAQLAELKALYAVTPHPAREVREALGSRIGMRYQSVTNWFQNQRSTAKKRAPIASQIRTADSPRTSSRSRSRRTTLSPSPARTLPHAMEDNMADDSNASGDDDVQQGRSMEQQPEDNHDDYQPPTLRTRTRTDPVRDIIVAQAAARQQQQLIELPLPLSGAAIVPSSFSDLESNTQSADSEFKITLPPAPRTTSAPAPAPSSRAPTPLLSSFQLSRAQSPSAVSTNASVLDTCGEEAHGTEADYGEGATADQVPRGKRSRPTPHQLAALRALHSVTSSPSIEERTRVGREIGMELGKVTNWFRNLRQTARKKERRAFEAEGVNQYSKRGKNRDLSRARQNKRSRLALDEDDDDTISASPSLPHVHSTFERSSTVGSVDMDYDNDRPDAYFIRHHRVGALAGSRDAYVERPYFGEYDNPRFSRSSSFDGPSTGYLLPGRRHDETQLEGHPEHEHEHDHESRSELGTESDAAHEAVTPEPQSLPPCTERIPPTPLSMTAASSRGSPTPADADDDHHHSTSSHSKHPSVDDAMLLLAFHGART